MLPPLGLGLFLLAAWSLRFAWIGMNSRRVVALIKKPFLKRVLGGLSGSVGKGNEGVDEQVTPNGGVGGRERSVPIPVISE